MKPHHEEDVENENDCSNQSFEKRHFDFNIFEISLFIQKMFKSFYHEVIQKELRFGFPKVIYIQASGLRVNTFHL